MQRRYRKHKPLPKLTKRFRVNEQIFAEELMVIDDEGNSLGLLKTKDALVKAEEEGLDLVEVSPKAVPPVARIIDFGHFKYEQEKKVKKQKAQAKRTDVKGIRLTPRIKGQDLDLRHEQAKKFLEAGHRVKIEMILRGREKAHTNIAIDLINEFVNNLGDQIKILDPVKRMGSRVSVELTNK
jgi:translation initiation factor IF-3